MTGSGKAERSSRIWCSAAFRRGCPAVLHGTDILNPNWPDAQWDVSGMFYHDWLLLDASRRIEEWFDCRLPIVSLHGSYGLLWQGGRYMSSDDHLQCLDSAFPRILSEYTQRGIDCFYTFSNWLLTPAHLQDPSCNYMLQQLWTVCGEGSGVIVVSDLLCDYVRSAYPRLTIKSSIDKVVAEDGKGDPRYYQRLAERFDVVNIHPDDGFNYDLLEELSNDYLNQQDRDRLKGNTTLNWVRSILAPQKGD